MTTRKKTKAKAAKVTKVATVAPRPPTAATRIPIDSYPDLGSDLVYEVAMEDGRFIVFGRHLSDGELLPAAPIVFHDRDQAISVARSLASSRVMRLASVPPGVM